MRKTAIIFGLLIAVLFVNMVFADSLHFTPETIFNSGETNAISVSSLDSTHFVVVYQDGDNSDYGTARIGHFTGSSISWDTSETIFNSGKTYRISVSSLDSTHFVVVYQDISNSDYGTARIGHFTGSSISWDTPETVFNSGETNAISVSSLDSTHFVVAYEDYSNSKYGTARIGHFTGSSISWDTPETVFNSGVTWSISTASLDSTHFVVVYQDISNSDYGTARIGHFTGSSISWDTSETIFNSGETNYIFVSSLDSTHFVVVYQDISNSYYGTARIGHFTGSSISWDTSETIFNSGKTYRISVSSLDSTHFVVAYEDYSYYGTARIGHFTGSSISWDTSETVFNSGTTDFISVSSLTSTHFVVAYRDGSNSKYGTARIGNFFHISLSLTPNPIYTNNNATCSAEFSSTADNATLKWYVNGAEIASAEQNCTDCSSISGTLTSDNFVKGDTIKCEVTATSGTLSDTKDASEVVSNSPPVVQSQAISGGYNSTLTGGIYSNITLECNATDTDSDTITEYAFYIADSEGNENLVYNGSENSYTMNVSNYTTGNYTFECKAYDTEELTGAPSYYNFTIDNSPPNITITSPQNDTNINHGNNVLFNYTVNDTYSILSNVTDSNGKSFTSIGSTSLNVNYTFNVTDGQQYFTVTAEDALGNKANKTIQYKIVLGVFVIAVNENTLEPMYAVIEMQNESVDYQFPQYLVWDHSEMLGDKIKESEFKLFANDSYDYTKFEIDSLTNQTVADINEIDFTIDNLLFASGNPTARMDIWMLSSDDFDNPSLSTSISDIKNNGTKVVTDFILDNYLYAGNGTKVQIPLDVPYRVAYGKSYVILFYVHDTSGVKEIDVRYDGDSGAPTNIQRFKSDNTAGTSYAGYFITMKSIGVNELYVPFHTEYLPTGNNVHITVYSGEWVRDYSMVINMSTFANPILYVFIPEPPAENQYYRIQNEGGIGIEGASVVFSRYINNESYTITSATSGADGTLSALLELHKIYKITVIADGYETKSFVESVSGSHSYPSTAEVITLKAVSSSYNNTISVDYPGKGISLSISPEVLLYPYNSGSEYLFCDATSENNNLANLTMIVLRKNLSSLETETIFNQSTSSNNQVLSLSYYLNKTESAGSTIMVTCNLTTIENETYYAKRNYYIPFKNQEVFDTNKVNVGHMTVYIFFLLISLYISYLASMLDIRFGLLVFILMIVITTTFVSTYLYFSVLLIVVAFIYVWLMSRS